MRRTAFAWFAFAIGLGGCEGTWATPSSFPIAALHGSQASGIAIVGMRCITTNDTGRCTEWGSSLEVQFQHLHDAARYDAFVRRGWCAHPGPQFEPVPLYAASDRDGLLGFAEIHIPVHHFLKDGYAAMLYDRRGRHAVACGDLRSDRLW